MAYLSSQSFDNTGNSHKVMHIVNDDANFNLDAYKAFTLAYDPPCNMCHAH